jgi:PAS domain S-box-containing protein
MIQKLIYPSVIIASFLIVFHLKAEVIGKDSVIRVGIFQNQPKLYFDNDKNPAGIFVELIQEIAKNEGWKVVFVKGNWPEHLENLKDGTIDLLPDFAFTPERNELFILNKIPVIESWSKLYVHPKIAIKTIADLKGKKIAIPEGSVQHARFNQIMKGSGYDYETLITNSFDDAFSMVSIGLADGVIANHLFGEMHYNLYGLKQTSIGFNSAPLHFAVFYSEKAYIINTIDKYLKNWIDTPNSVYYQIIGKHDVNPFIVDDKHSRLNWIKLVIAIVFLTGVIFFILLLLIKRKEKDLFQTNRSLKWEENKFRIYIENAPYGIFIANEEGKFTDVNPMSCNLTGYSKDELQTKNITDLIPTEAHDLALDHFKQVVNGGKAIETVPYLTKEGEIRFWKVNAVKISDQLFLGMVNDVTDEKITQSKLNWYGQIFDQSINEIYLFETENYRYTLVNEAALKNLGYSFSEILKMTPFDLKLNITVMQFKTIIEPLITGIKKQITYETHHFRKDGTYYEAEIHLQIIEYEGVNQFLAVVIDITERKKAEQELVQLRAKLENEIKQQTEELQARIAELEQFREVTIERELRMEQLRREIEILKKLNTEK